MLVEDLVPRRLPLCVVIKVLQNLLAECGPIRNVRSTVESLAEKAAQSQVPGVLTAAMRVVLGRHIVHETTDLGTEVPAITLAPELEQILPGSLADGGEVAGAAVKPGLADRLQQSLADVAPRQEICGEPAVLLVAPLRRPRLVRFIRHVAQNLLVLACNEVSDDRSVRLVQGLGQ